MPTPRPGSLVMAAVFGFVTAAGAPAQVPPATQRVVRRSELARLLGDSLSRQAVLTRVGAGRTDTISNTADSVTLTTRQTLAVSVGSVARHVAAVRGSTPHPGEPAGRTDTVLALPYRFIVTAAAGSTTQFLRPEVDRGELRYGGQPRMFRGTLHIVLKDSLHPGEDSIPLSSPIRFHFTAAGGATVSPANLSIPYANLPPHPIEVAVETPDDSIRVHIRPTLSLPESDVWIPVVRPHIALQSAQASIPGFGLATVEVNVSLPPEAGAAPRSVILSARHARPVPSHLDLVAGGVGTVTIRSVGVGEDVIEATAIPFHSIPVVITYEWPILFLVAALLGGATGGLIARTRARHRGQRASTTVYSLSGLAAGLLCAVAFAVGINLTGIEIATQTGEAVVFVVAALGSLLGLKGLAAAVPALGKVLQGGDGD